MLFVIAGCGGSGGPSATVNRTTVSDTLVVTTTPPVDPGPSLYRFELDLTIGEPEGAEEYMLLTPGSVSADADGNIFISDQSAGEIRAFDRDGRHLTTFGRRGAGPGEFNSNYWGWFRVRAVEGGRITVEDLPRLRVFDSGGGYISSFDLMLTQSREDRLHNSTIGIEWFPERELLLARWSWNLPDRTNVEALVLLDESLIVVEEMPPSFIVPGLHQEEGRAFSLPFSPDFEWTTSGDRLLAWGASSAYRIDLYDLDTGQRRRAVLDLPAESVTAADIQAFKDEFLGREWMEGQEGIWGPMLNRARYPSVKPFFAEMIGDDEGRIWVRRYSPITGPDGAEWYRYDLFDADAEWLGIVDTPLTPGYIRDGYAYRLDYEEYPVIERYRLVPESTSDQSGG